MITRDKPPDAGGVLQDPQEQQAAGHRAPAPAQRALGEHITLQFEDEQTIRRQIQEMLHIEKIFDDQTASRPRSRPTRRWCPTAATGRRRC
jgi:hypothetical protein